MVVAAISDTIERGFEVFFAWLPALAGALVVLILGYIVAKILGRVVGRVLERAGLDRNVMSGRSGEWISRATSSPSRLLGRIVFWAVFLGAVALAVSVLGINALTDFMGRIFLYLPNVIAALLIFLVAGLVAGAAAALVERTMGDTPTGKILRAVVPGLIMAIALFMILEQLEIAPEIVRITYAALIGALALAAALAFGLGGRDVAARMLEDAYIKGQRQREQVRRDMQVGKARGREQFAEAKERAETEAAERDAATRPGSTTRL
jgi:TRAP-type C4-dicarboxylate transport system permease small subunit